MKKRITIVIFSLLLFSLISCGQKSIQDYTSTGTDQAQTNKVIKSTQSKIQSNEKPLNNNVQPIKSITVTPSEEIEEVPMPRIDDTTKINEPKYAYKNWVKSTYPINGSENVSPTSNISIKFGQDMNPDTLNKKTIEIIDGKHSSNISDIYNYSYNKKTRVLSITFKYPEGSIGSGNGLDITITKDVMNSKKEKLGVDLHFGYCGQ